MTRVKVAESFAPFAGLAMKRYASVSLLALLCALVVFAIEGRAADSTTPS